MVFNEARFRELKEKARIDKNSLTKSERDEYRQLRDEREDQRASDLIVKEEAPVTATPQTQKSNGARNENGREKSPTKKTRVNEITEEQIEPENRWWEKYEDADNMKKKEIMWDSLEHHGIMFPPAYQSHGIPLLYGPKDGPKKRIVLPPTLEEMATYWCGQIGLESETKDIFINNFWNEFLALLQETKKSNLIRLITDFHQCDWSEIHAYLQQNRERKKQMSKEAKELQKKEKEKGEAEFRFCLINGYRTRVGNIMVEPPGLFKGRGEHPKQGKLKDRILPSVSTMNCDNGLPPPICHVPGWSWGSVVHDDSVNWLGYYKQETDEKETTKYIQLDKTSESKGQPDLLKYERARRLCTIVDVIRKDYQIKLLKGDTVYKRQLGSAAYFIDRLALRVGNEKNTDEEADTVGCTSLRVEHVKFEHPQNVPWMKYWDNLAKGITDLQRNPKPNTSPKITLDFLGKDSIRYLNEVQVPPSLLKNLRDFKKGKSKGQQIFHEVSPPDINTYFQEFMPDLTAKVFRTYNASFTLESQLALYSPKLHGTSQEELITFYNNANKKVAILCNHQKAVSKGHEGQMEKQHEKGKDLTRRLEELKKQLKYLKKGDTANIREKDEAGKTLPKNVEGTEREIAKAVDRIKKHASDILLKDTNKNVSLTTSKINYMDPRITISFCKRVGLDVSKVFSKTIQQKFPWAMDVKKSYHFVRTGNTPRGEFNTNLNDNSNMPQLNLGDGSPNNNLKRPNEGNGDLNQNLKRQKEG